MANLSKDQILAHIALTQLAIDSLETRNVGDLDFSTYAVWDIDYALRDAYGYGLRCKTPDPDLMLAIAKEHLFLETLKARSSDALDFHEHAVWSIKAALGAAYDAGHQ